MVAGAAALILTTAVQTAPVAQADEVAHAAGFNANLTWSTSLPDAGDAPADPRLERVVTSVHAALEAIDANPVAHPADPVTEPDLRELAMRVSAMVTSANEH